MNSLRDVGNRRQLPGIDAIQAEIFAVVLRNGPLTRKSIAQRVGVDPSTITRALPDLMSGGWLSERPSRPNRPGRPSMMVAVQQDHHIAVGVKIGPDLLTGVATDLLATPLARARRPVTDRSPEVVLAEVADLVGGLVAEASAVIPDPNATVVGLGVGASGHIQDARICRYSPIMGWRDIDIATPLAAATGLPVVVNNDVNTLAVAHHWYGSGRLVEDMAVVTIGRGVGCGLILAGQLHEGAEGSAGELGHIPLDPNGPRCACGRTGCLEAMASDTAIVAAVNSARPGSPVPDATAAAELARAGDPVALAAFDRAGDALGRGIAVVLNMLNLEQMVLSGELASAYDLLEPALRRAMRSHSFSDAASTCRLVVDRTDESLWERGAACLAVRAAVRRRPAMTYPVAAGL